MPFFLTRNGVNLYSLKLKKKGKRKMKEANTNQKHRAFNYLFADKDGNTYANIGLPGNQIGHGLNFAVKLTPEQVERGWITEDEIIAQQYGCTGGTPSARAFRKSILRDGGKMLSTIKCITKC